MANALFRSRLQALPIDLKIRLGELSLQIGMTPSKRQQEMMNAFKEFNIPVVEVGTGTNRTIVKYDRYALKIALDEDGVADNKQEWVMSSALMPDVAPAFDISAGGHLLMAAYCPAFSTYSEFCQYRTTITEILKKWGTKYLLGDVGVTRKNYANWGLSKAGKPVCIDYAYIFPASMDIFTCTCGNNTLTFSDTTFNSYMCPKCKAIYSDSALRSLISNEERMKLFEDVKGIRMYTEREYHEIPDEMIKHE